MLGRTSYLLSINKIIKNPMNWDFVEHLALAPSAQLVLGAKRSRGRDNYL
jgi:hypothetical protein